MDEVIMVALLPLLFVFVALLIVFAMTKTHKRLKKMYMKRKLRQELEWMTKDL